MIATAAERTRHIKLGTGVVSVSYHNPLWVAERLVLLDHLTRGRAMLGLGPGSLPTDGIMIGIQQSQTRGLLEDGLAIIMQLLTSDAPVTFRNERWDLREARLHLRPYSDPVFDVAVAAVASPTGPKLRGAARRRHAFGRRHDGCRLRRSGAPLGCARSRGTSPWQDCGPQQVAAGRPMPHCRDEGTGLSRRRIWHRHWFRYFQQVAAFPQMAVAAAIVPEMIEFMTISGLGAIGTADMLPAQIEKLWNQSNGGFGAYLLLAHNWANPQATQRSYDLVARNVFPKFQGHHASTAAAADRARASRPELAEIHSKAVEVATQRYQKEATQRAH